MTLALAAVARNTKSAAEPSILKRSTQISAVVLGLLIGMQSSADIYRYRDSQGGILLTDKARTESIFTLEKTYRFKKYASPRSGGKVASFKTLKDRIRAMQPIMDEVSVDYDINVDLLHAVILAESAYDAKAVSSAGAQGLMQLIPATAKRFGVLDSFDPEQNMRGGAAYLKWLLERFDDDLELALAAYNAGEGAVEKYGRSIPPYPETTAYVRKVKDFFYEGIDAVLN